MPPLTQAITMMQRIAITGSSGYLGTRLVEFARRKYSGTKILGLDVKHPVGTPPDEFHSIDIRSPELAKILSQFLPDTVIHSAFSFQPSHNDELMRSVNIDGCRNLLESVAQSMPACVHFLSSATAFGAWPDNPLPIPEDRPVKGRPEFRYAADKADIENILAEFAGKHSEIALSWTRPAIIVGPHMDNYLERFIFGMPFLIKIDDYDMPLQFVHEDDVTASLFTILEHRARGGFNVGPDDWITISEIAHATRRRTISIPFWVSHGLSWAAWKLRLWYHEFPPGFLYFGRFPWVVQSTRLQTELGYQFQYTCHEAMQAFLASR